MNQIEKLASAAYLIKVAQNAANTKKGNDAAANANTFMQDLTNIGSLFAGAAGGALAGGLSGRKYLSRLLKKLDLKSFKDSGKNIFGFRNNLRKYKDDYPFGGEYIGKRLGFGLGAYGGYKLSDKMLTSPVSEILSNTDKLKEQTAVLEKELEKINKAKSIAAAAGLATLLGGGGYLAHKAMSGKKEEKPEKDKKPEKLASSIYLIKKANLEDFLTKHPQYADLLLRPLLGAGIGYGAHRVGELVSPSKDEEERKNNRNRSLLLGTSVGLGGALSSTLRKLHKFQEEDALSSALRKLHKFQD